MWELIDKPLAHEKNGFQIEEVGQHTIAAMSKDAI